MPDRVLIVDDEPDILNLAKAILEKKGYEIAAVSNGVEALKRAELEVPDLILLDVVMPGMSGLEVCKTLKTQNKTSLIPVVMFTVLGRDIDRKLTNEAGADAHFLKPFTPEELSTIVKDQIEKRRVERFSKQIGVSHSELKGRKILLEFESSSLYERLVRDFVLECVSNNEEVVLVGQPGSPVDCSLKKRMQSDQRIHPVYSYTSQPIISDILREHTVRPLGFVYDSLTDLALSIDTRAAYKFARDALKLLADPEITALFLFNPSAHEQKDVYSIQGVFTDSIFYSNKGVAKIR